MTILSGVLVSHVKRGKEGVRDGWTTALDCFPVKFVIGLAGRKVSRAYHVHIFQVFTRLLSFLSRLLFRRSPRDVNEAAVPPLCERKGASGRGGATEGLVRAGAESERMAKRGHGEGR